MIPNLFILSVNGEVLIEKQWIGRHKRTVCDLFWEESAHIQPTKTLHNLTATNTSPSHSTSSSTTPSSPSSSLITLPSLPRHEIPPVIHTPRYTFITIYRSQLTFLVVSSKETPPLFILEFLQLTADIFLEYFNQELTELTLREHFATVYQLLDEMIDGGYTSTTELNLLKEMITPPSLTNKLIQSVTNEFAVSDRLPSGALSKIPWRKSVVNYVTNEIYFDLIESIDAIITANGQVIHSTVYGDMKCNCRLSGIPDLTLSFTRPHLLDDISLHRCVRINRYQREHVISFVPPDGPFKLLSYKIQGALSMPIYIKPLISYSRSTYTTNNSSSSGQWQQTGKINIMVGSKLSMDKTISNMTIFLPFPCMIRSHTIQVNYGKIIIEQNGLVLRWDLGRLPRDLTPILEGTVSLQNEGKYYNEIPVCTAQFQVKSYAVSGLKVEGLAIRNVGYSKPFKGVRSVTQAGKFQIRCID